MTDVRRKITGPVDSIFLQCLDQVARGESWEFMIDMRMEPATLGGATFMLSVWADEP